MEASRVGLSVLVHGRRIREYGHDGKVYVEGREGSEFSLLVSNGTGKRIKVVASVDGLSVLNGKPAELVSGADGYVVGVGKTLKVSGWRIDSGSVSRFVFAKRGQSYAAVSQSSADDCGVVGVAAFFEREPPPETVKIYPSYPVPYPVPYPVHPRPSYPDIFWRTEFTCSSETGPTIGSAGFSCSSLAGPDLSQNRFEDLALSQELGTGFGRAAHDPVEETEFDQRERPFAVLEVYYDTLKGLEARGVCVRGERSPRRREPRAFRDERYCSLPDGWCG